MSQDVRVFLNNLRVHAKRVVTRHETLREAWASIRGDGRKLAQSFEPSATATRRHDARALVRAGRRSYNNSDYETAEMRFRDAITEDPSYTLALTYLGNALFQCGRLTEAKAAWKRAYDQDPYSEAGQKAYAKWRRVEAQGRDLAAQMQERVERL